MHKQLYLSNINKMIGGVCGGLAEYFDIDPVIIRIIFVVLAVTAGGGLLAYIILWIIVPRAPLVIASPPDNNSDNSSTNETKMNQSAETSFSGASMEHQTHSRRYFDGRLFAALLLIIVGLFWMLDNIIPQLHFIKFWPIVLIILGILILMKSKNE